MQLIGMLDSPYVRRTAISLKLLGIPFEHKSVSVFSTFEQFQAINPVVKAPSLVCDDGTVLMDSTLIIEYAESMARDTGRASQSLMPASAADRLHELRLLSLSLAACEKAVQIVYERNLRPIEKQHEPWLTRIRSQMLSAFALLEKEVSRRPPRFVDGRTSQAGVTIGVVWQFVQSMVAEIVIAAEYPAIREFSAAAEKLPAFAAFPPDGLGVPKK